MRSAIVLNSGSDEHGFISFVPTSIEGLDGPIAVSEEITFDIAGDLTIKGTTQTVTFSVTAVLEAADRLSGQAEAEVLRTDFGIGIPRAPGVADVTDEVIGKIMFASTIAFAGWIVLTLILFFVKQEWISKSAILVSVLGFLIWMMAIIIDPWNIMEILTD